MLLSLQVNWGSSAQAVTYRTILAMSYQYNEVEDHVKNFRPQCLVLCGSPENHGELVHLVSHITKNNGLMICGEVSQIDSAGSKQNDRKKATDWLRRNKIKAFSCICAGTVVNVYLFIRIVNSGFAGFLVPAF